MPLSLAPELLRRAVDADVRGVDAPDDVRALVRVERCASCARYALVDQDGADAVAWRCDRATTRPALYPSGLPWRAELPLVAWRGRGRTVAAWPVDASEAVAPDDAETQAAELALALMPAGSAATGHALAWTFDADVEEAAALEAFLSEMVAEAGAEGWSTMEDRWAPEGRMVRLSGPGGERWITLSPAPRPRLLLIERSDDTNGGA